MVGRGREDATPVYLQAGVMIVRVDFLVLSWPVGTLFVFALVAVVAGLVAAIFPARRAARLNILEALQYE